jgi:prophage maintenance system killer protein
VIEMSENILWLSEKGIRAIHRQQILRHGGSAGLRDEGLLQSVSGG